jgi:hypothetical protein
MENIVIFYGPLQYFTAICIILWSFCNGLILWYIFHRFGVLCQEKPGNPAVTFQIAHETENRMWKLFPDQPANPRRGCIAAAPVEADAGGHKGDHVVGRACGQRTGFLSELQRVLETEAGVVGGRGISYPIWVGSEFLEQMYPYVHMYICMYIYLPLPV